MLVHVLQEADAKTEVQEKLEKDKRKGTREERESI
jgi:hypothetical protein